MLNRFYVLAFVLLSIFSGGQARAAATFTVGFTVAGLTPNSGLVLQNGSDIVPISAAGTGSFPTALPNGASYNVTVAQVPGNPVQYCTVTGGSGTINNANVTAPRITCAVRYGRFAYTTGTCPDSCANSEDNAISIFGLTASGQWRHRGYTVTTGTATAVRVAPSQQWVYVTTSPAKQLTSNGSIFVSQGTLTGYMVDGTTGRLTPINSVTTDAGPTAMEFDPQGKFLFLASAAAEFDSTNGHSDVDSIESLTIDPRSGSLTDTAFLQLDPSLGQLRKIVVDPTGHYLYAIFASDGLAAPNGSISSFSIDPSTGALTAGPTLARPSTQLPNDLMFDPAGHFLYVVDESGDVGDVATYQVNASSGALTLVSSVSAGTSPLNTPTSIAIDPASQFAYVLNSSAGAPTSFDFNVVSVFSIDKASGALTAIANQGVSSTLQLAGLAMDPSGNFLDIASASPLSATANGTSMGNSFEITTFPISRGNGQLTGQTNSNGLLLPSNTVETRGAQRAIDLTHLALTRSSSPAAPIGKFVFSADALTDDITTYAINSSSGALTTQTTTLTTAAVSLMATDVFGQTAYVTANASNTMFNFSINPTNGALSLLGSATGQTQPNALAVDPSGRFAYTGLGSQIQVFKGAQTIAEAQTSTADTCTPNTCGTIDALTVDPTGRLLFAANPATQTISAFRIDPSLGTLTEIGVTSTAEHPFVLSPDPTGRFIYSLDAVKGVLTQYAISPSGSLTSVGAPLNFDGGPSNISANALAMAIDPSGRFAYVAQQVGDNTVLPFTLDPLTGAPTMISGGAVSQATAVSLSIDPSGKFLYVPDENTNTVSTWRINPSTGVLTSVGSTSSGRFPVTVVTTGTTP